MLWLAMSPKTFLTRHKKLKTQASNEGMLEKF